MKILVADDSKAMRMIVKRGLRQAGFGAHTIVEADDGAAALDAIRSDPPDLVLVDWNMPRMTGLELLRALRSNGINMKLGFVTSESTPEMRKLAQENGALFLISKPFTAEDLKTHLAPVLG